MSFTATLFATVSLLTSLPNASTSNHGPIMCPDCNDLNRSILPETNADPTPATCRIRLFQDSGQLKAAVFINGLQAQSATLEVEQSGLRWLEYLDLNLPDFTVGLPAEFNPLAPRVFRVVIATQPQTDRVLICPEI